MMILYPIVTLFSLYFVVIKMIMKSYEKLEEANIVKYLLDIVLKMDANV